MTLNRITPGAALIFTFIFTLFVSSACSKKKQIRGSEFVQRETMVDMMVEMHLIDGLTNDVSYYRKFNPNDSVDLYGSVFGKYDIGREDFHATLLEYSSEPRLLDKLYADVLKELNLMQEELDRLQREELEKKKPAVPNRTQAGQEIK